MATYDPERGWVVLRIVYDGAALAGKTTSLKALAESLGRPLFSGDEAEGRTLYLDWVDFVGGRFAGSPIRCQIVAVPGQVTLAGRRRELLAEADAVVLVADSSSPGLAEAARALGELIDFLRDRDPPVGILVQANKRDLPDARPLGEIEHLAARAGTVALVETVAQEGHGVREAFVFAVRLALDRVREIESRGGLPRRPPGADSGEALLAALRAAETDPQDSREATGGLAAGPDLVAGRPLLSADGTAPRPAPRTGPRLPDSEIPPGGLWPPIEGRVLLREAERSPPAAERSAQGDWTATGPEWCWHSWLDDHFEDPVEGRSALLEWARWHTQARPWLSSRRAIALAEAAEGAWRLWQVVGRVRTLEDRLVDAIAGGDPIAISDALWAASRALFLADRDLLRAGGLHRAGLPDLAEEAGRVVYTGLAPGASQPPARPRLPEEPSQLLRRHLSPLLDRAEFHRRAAVPRVLERILESGSIAGRERYAETLAALVLGR